MKRDPEEENMLIENRKDLFHGIDGIKQEVGASSCASHPKPKRKTGSRAQSKDKRAKLKKKGDRLKTQGEP